MLIGLSFGSMVRRIDNDEETGCTLRMDWDSVADAIDGLDNAAPRAKSNRDALTESGAWWGGRMCDKRDRAWLTTALERGDSDTLAAVETMRERITATSPAFAKNTPRRARKRAQECGDEIDSDRFMRRDSECWDRMERTARPSKSIVLAVEVGVLGGVDRDELLPRGAAIVAFADWLVKEGYSVEIRAIWHSVSIYNNESESSGIGTIIVKPARAPLDVAAIATSCCEIAFARGVLLRSRIMHAKRRVSGGLGRTTAVPAHVLKALGVDVSASSDILTQRAAEEWLAAAIATITERVAA